MTKGRGSNERRRNARQKRAIVVNRMLATDPEAIRYDTDRGRRIHDKRNSKNFVVSRHPLERKR